MPLTSIYNAVKQQPLKARTIQQVLSENPEKVKMFEGTDIVAGKNLTVLSSRGSSTSVNAIASELGSAKTTSSPLPFDQRKWQDCKSRKEKNGAHFCQKFMMRCVQDKCPKKFIDV